MAQAKKPQQEDELGGPMSQVQFVEQARALNEQIVETATRVGQDAVQRYVDWLQAVADMQRTLGSSPQASQMDWFASMMKAKADFNEQFAKMVGGCRRGASSRRVSHPPAGAAGCRVRHRQMPQLAASREGRAEEKRTPSINRFQRKWS
jgi:hypothetical protein